MAAMATGKLSGDHQHLISDAITLHELDGSEGQRVRPLGDESDIYPRASPAMSSGSWARRQYRDQLLQGLKLGGHLAAGSRWDQKCGRTEWSALRLLGGVHHSMRTGRRPRLEVQDRECPMLSCPLTKRWRRLNADATRL
jgi:hypothetical protein